MVHFDHSKQMIINGKIPLIQVIMSNGSKYLIFDFSYGYIENSIPQNMHKKF